MQHPSSQYLQVINQCLVSINNFYFLSHTATYFCTPLPVVTTTIPSHFTTDSNTTPSSTAQQPEETSTHGDLPTMLTDAASNEAPPLTNPLGQPKPSNTLSVRLMSTLPSGTEQFDMVTRSTEPENCNRTSFPAAVTAGIIVSLVLFIISTITLTVSLAVCLKARKINRATINLVNSQAYGVTLQNMATHKKESTYTYPRVGQADTTGVKWNEAYTTNIITEGNEAYAANIVTQGNEAYKAVTSVTVSESVDMYDYVKS